MKKLKKGFTLVELVIVIAVIAVLAAVLIPTFSGIIQKAKVSNDVSAVTSMNQNLADYRVEYQGLDDDFAVLFATLKDRGYDFSTLNTNAGGYHYVWEKTEKNMLLYDNNFKFVPTTGLTAEKATWELCLPVKSTQDIITVEGKNFDYVQTANITGNINITTPSSFYSADKMLKGNLSIVTDKQADIDVAANINGTLTINGENLNVSQFDTVKKIDAVAVKDQSLHINGIVTEELAITKGRVVIEQNSSVATLDVKATTDVKVENNGYLQNVTSTATPATQGDKINLDSVITNNGFIQAVDTTKVEETPTVAPTTGGSDFTMSIKTLAQLEAFRDAVNNGATFKGAVVELDADIALNDGWTPIGAFARDTTAKGFQGTFDGNNHTISNLNNKGYVPGTDSLFKNDSTLANKKEYLYGFFGVTSGVTIQDLKLASVNINIENGTQIYGDKVGALIGYNTGDLTISGCEVIGSVSAYDGVGGFVGGAYNLTGASNFVIEIINSTNNAEVTGAEKAAGFIGYVGIANNGSVYFQHCVNAQKVTVTRTTVGSHHLAHAAGFAVVNSTATPVIFTENSSNSGVISVQYTVQTANVGNVGVSAFAINNDAATLTAIDVSGVTNTGTIKLNGVTKTVTATEFEFHETIPVQG